jgi:predicted XRE-type DNA-binding protein
VFEAFEDDPAVAQNLNIRSELMMSFRKYIEDEGLEHKKGRRNIRRCSAEYQ